MAQTNPTQSNGTSTAVVRSQNDKIRTLSDMFEKNKSKIAQVLPKHLTPERLVKIAVSACSRNPDLLSCDQRSIFVSVLQAAELGLEFGATLGQAYLVPFRNNKAGGRMEAQFIPGYRGLITLARRSGEIASIEAVLVYENDTFEIERGLSPKLVHRPFLDGDPGKVKLAYGIARFKDGGFQVEVMTLAELEAIRNRSKAKDSGPWVTDTAEMYRKTVIRRLFKYCPMSVEIVKAVAAMDAAEGDGKIDADLSVFETSTMAPEEETKALPEAPTESLKEKLAARAKEEPVLVKRDREPGED